MRILFAGLTLACLVLLSTPIGVGAQNQGNPKWGGTLVYAIPGNPQALNPAIAGGSGLAMSMSNIFQPLVSHQASPDGSWVDVPVLAKSWETSADGLTYTFHLRDNVTWSDGIPFTSADVKFSFENAIIPLNPSGKATWGVINSISTPDDYTVVFNLKTPYAPFMTYQSFLYAPIIAKHVYTFTNGSVYSSIAIQNAKFDLAHVIGTGPFLITEYVSGDHITLVRNPNYWKQGLPYLDRVVYKVIPQAEVRPVALQSGDVDYVPQYIGSADLPTLSKDSNIVVTTKGMEYAAGQFNLVFNMQNSTILSKKLVRTAIAYAINKEELSRLATDGTAPVSTTAISSESAFWFNPNVHEPNYDLTMANQLLDQAGYPRGPDGNRFSLRFNYDVTYSNELTSMVQVLTDQLKKVGINVVPNGMDNPTYVATTWVKLDYDLTIWPVTTGPDPSVLNRLYSSKSITRAFLTNGMGYKNSQIDALLDQAVQTLEPNARKALYWQIQAILAEDLPCIDLVHRVYFSAYRTSFQGLGNNFVYGFRDPTDQVWWVQATGTSPPGQQGTTTTSVATSQTAQPSAGPFPLELVAAVLVAIVALSLVAIALRRRKKPA